MAGFAFKLNGLLKVKEKIEEQKKIELGKALSSLSYEEEKLNEIKNRRVQVIESQREAVKNVVNIANYTQMNNFIKQLDKQEQHQLVKIKQAEIIVNERKEELMEAMKERKSLEKLKENEQIAYNKEVLMKEQKIVDEIVSYKYNKQ